MYYTYILFSEKLNKYYTGSTGNIEDRIKRHNSGRSTYTKNGIPWQIVFLKTFETRAEAVKFEMHIKAQKSSEYITHLVESIPIESGGS